MKTLKISLLAVMVSLLTSANVNAQNVVHSMKSLDKTLLKMSIVYSPTTDSTDFGISKIYFDGANVGDDGALTLTTMRQGVFIEQRINPSRSYFNEGSQTRVAVFDSRKVNDVTSEPHYYLHYELASGLNIDVTADVKQIMDANK